MTGIVWFKHRNVNRGGTVFVVLLHQRQHVNTVQEKVKERCLGNTAAVVEPVHGGERLHGCVVTVDRSVRDEQQGLKEHVRGTRCRR